MVGLKGIHSADWMAVLRVEQMVLLMVVWMVEMLAAMMVVL